MRITADFGELVDQLPKSSRGIPLVGTLLRGHTAVPFDMSDYHEWNKNDEETTKQLFAEKIEVLAEPLAEQLYQKRWIVLCVDRPMFLTGDAPLVKIGGDGIECGINQPDAMLFFPLSPSRTLFMSKRKGAEMDGFFPVSQDTAKQCNVVIGVNSPTYLFSSTELLPEMIAALTNKD